MKEIVLTQGKVTLVDDEDYDWLNQFKWYVIRPYKIYYAQRHLKRKENQRQHQYMHRLIMNAQLGQAIDHVNCDGLDNRKVNLRFATPSQNNGNWYKYAGSSVYKGVYWYKQTHKWRANINKDRRHLHLGYFDDEREAARAYDKAALELYGEYARLNNV